MISKQERFTRLAFPIHKVTAKTPVELFEILPGLRRYFQKLIPEGEFEIVDNTHTTVDGKAVVIKVPGYQAKYRGIFIDDLVKIIKYIVFVYDPDSDLFTEYPGDLRLIKEAAAKEAGFKRTTEGEWPLYVQDIFDFKEKAVVEWILDYLKLRKNSTWMQLKFTEEELDSLYRQRAAVLLRGEVKADLMRLIKEREEEKDTLIKRFYAEHTDLKRAAQDEMFPVSPENVFSELKIPAEVWKIRQVKDVPKDTGIEEAHN